VSLSNQEGIMGESKEVIIDFKAESEAKSTAEDEAKPHDGHNKEAKWFIDSKAQCVAYLKKK